MSGVLAIAGRSVLIAVLSFQIIVGARPWFLGGGFEPRRAEAAAESDSNPVPMPNGSAPADRVKADAAAGFDYGVNTNSGAFGASIPIETPPGRLGVEPKLALAYSSSSGTPGIAGVGWDLVVPAIRRDPVQPLLGAPRYLLDGRRLIEDGAGGFATEQDTYARIRQGCNLNSCFIVDDHEGLRSRFGGTSDSRIPGRWGLDRVEDSHGNYMTVTYMTDADFSAQFASTSYVRDGALVPKEIRYTGSASRAPWYTVRFDYDLRGSSDSYTFQSGSAASERLRYRLKAIRVLGASNVTIRTYTMVYAFSATGRTLLTGVALTGQAGATGPQPFTMTYTASASGFAPPTPGPAPSKDSRVVIGDFTGDGISDLVTYRRTDESGLLLQRWRLQRGTPTGLSTPEIWLTGHGYEFPGSGGCANGNDKLFAGDWDADGDTDLFHYSSGCGAPRWRVLVASNDRFAVRDWIPAAQTGFGSIFDAGTTGALVFGDFDADGRADALLYRAQVGSPSTIVYSRAGAPGYATSSSASGQGALVASGDFNGDRMLDVAMIASTGVFTAYCAIAGGGTLPCGSISLPGISAVQTGDFNGDGLTDLLVSHSTGTTLETSTRIGFVPTSTAPGGYGRAADVDGDGRDDLVSISQGTGTGTWVLSAWLQRGGSFVDGATAGFPAVTMGSTPTCWVSWAEGDVLAADFTGDGRADPLLRVRDDWDGLCPSAAAQFSTVAADAPAVDRLASIRTPTGLLLQPRYKRSIEVGRPLTLPIVDELWVRDFPRVVYTHLISPMIETHRYLFSGNRWDAARGELLGFSQGWDEIVERDLTARASYFQDAPRRGKLSALVSVRTSTSEVLAADLYQYRDDTTAPYRTELAWHSRQYWSGGAPTQYSLQGFEYDASGNQTRVDDHGLCSRTDDDRSTVTLYRTATDFTVNRAALVETYAGARTPPASLGGFAGGCTGSTSTLVTGTRNEYDNTPSSITRGDLTRVSRLVVGTTPSWLRVQDLAYRADGLLTSSTDARGYVTSVLSYDPVLDMYPAVIRNGVGTEETREYQPYVGKVQRVLDANGAAQTFTYDGFGRKQGVQTPLGAGLGVNTTTWIYGDGFPNWVATLAPYQGMTGSTQQAAAVEFHDALGRPLASVRDGDSMEQRVIGRRSVYWAATKMPMVLLPPVEVAATACSATSTCLAQWARTSPAMIDWQTLTTASGTPAQFTYDPLGRATRRTNPDSTFVSYANTVDALGFGTLETDEIGDQRRIYRDAHGEISRVERWPSISATPAVTQYAHDPRGKLTLMTSPRGVETRLLWNSLGNLEHVTSPEVGTLDFAYDADGHETLRSDGRGVSVSTYYDGIGRPTLRSASTGEIEAWAYDRTPMCVFGCSSAPPVADNTMGRPWATLDFSGYTTFAYDRDGLVARETRSVEGNTLTTSFVNWPTRQVVRKTYPDGETHRFAMAPDGEQAALFIGASTTPAVQVTRDAHGRPASVEYASGAAMRYVADPVTQRITGIITTDAAHQTAQDLTYAYRPDGVVDSIVRSEPISATSETLFLTHDGFKRVTDVFVAPETKYAAEHYEYDNDNRMTMRKDRGGSPLAVKYSDPAHPNAVTSIGARSFTYDGGGHRTEERDGATVTRAFDYDGHGRLSTVDGVGRFVYDADGRRVIERLPAGTRIVVGDYTREANGGTRKQLQLGALRLGERSAEPGQPARNRYFHADGAGSVIGESTEAGVFDTSRTFSAFGIPLAATGAGSRFGFGGYQVDEITGLSFAAARYYDPTTASFTQADTWLAGFDTPEVLNGYAYAANSPYQYADPSGHFPVAMLIAFAVGFAIRMAIDVDASDGTPDWGYLIVKNLVVAGASAALPEAFSWNLDYCGFPAWSARMVGRAFGSWAGTGLAQMFRNQERGNRQGYSYSTGWTAFVSLVTGVLATSIVETPLQFDIGQGITMGLTTGAGYVLVLKNPTVWINPNHSEARVAPAATTVAPPRCGAETPGMTMPSACGAAEL